MKICKYEHFNNIDGETTNAIIIYLKKQLKSFYGRRRNPFTEKFSLYYKNYCIEGIYNLLWKLNIMPMPGEEYSLKKEVDITEVRKIEVNDD